MCRPARLALRSALCDALTAEMGSNAQAEDLGVWGPIILKCYITRASTFELSISGF